MPTLRMALVQMNPRVGDVAGNATLIEKGLAAAREGRADLAVFPELALSGYPPKDLLLQEGFVEACTWAAKRLGEGHTKGLTAIFGLPLPKDPATHRAGAPIHNSLLVYRDGRHVAHYDKRLLPTYDVFDEDRYFTPGNRAAIVDVACGAGGSCRVGLSICEDLWKGEDAGFAHRYADAPDPVRELVEGGARVIVSPSASPFVLGKSERHRGIVASHATRHGVFVASLNQLGGNDELVFDGHALVYAPGGALMASGATFRDGVAFVDVPVDARAGDLPDPVPTIDSHALLDAVPERLLFEALMLGVRDYLRKTGFSRAILGLSGGIDSALTAAIACAALGSANVLGVAMPSVYSSEHSKSDAHDLARRLGMDCRTVPIEAGVSGLRGTIDPVFAELGQPRLGQSLPDLAEENLQSRIRGTILMALSNRTGAMVLTTGNKSELAVGYCTLYGDMNGGLAVLSDVSKQNVYALSRWINANWRACGFSKAPIPEASITKAPSAELRPNQTDQDSLPPYDVLDEILERYVEGRQAASRIARETGFDAALVARVVRMIDLAEYKRKQAAIGLKVTTVAFGSGRRWPIAQGFRG